MKRLKKSFLFLLVIPTICAFIQRYMPPLIASYFNLFTLASIPLALLNCVLCCVAICKKSHWKWIFGSAFIINIYLLGSTFNWNLKEDRSVNSENDIHVISWNVDNFLLNKDFLKQSASFIKQFKPNIICLQERPHTNLLSSDSIYAEYGLPNSVINSREDEVLNLAVYSQWELSNLHEFYFPNSYNKFLYVDVHHPNGLIRLFNVHLQTTGANDYVEGNLLKVFQQNALSRNMQSIELEKQLNKSPYPVIVCGDFNDVPFSYSYRKVKGSLQDCFIEKGNGWGGTFQSLWNLYRIDYIFVSPIIQVLDYHVYTNKWSDHKLQFAKLKFTIQ